MKNARKQYIDQLIISNYRKEKEKEIGIENNYQEQSAEEIENDKLVEDVFISEEVMESNPANTINSFNPVNSANSFNPVNTYNSTNSANTYNSFNASNSFNQVFQSKIDKTYEPFYGNSDFAPF